MAIQINQSSIELDTFDTEFVQMVQDRITSYGQIPYEVPQLMIISIIKECAKYFLRHYWRATETVWGLLEKKYFEHYNTTNGEDESESNPVISYTCVLPKGVQNVIEVYERGNNTSVIDESYQSIANSMQLINRQYSMTASGGFGLVGINNNLYVMETVSNIIENQCFESCCSTMVAFNFNIMSKRLLVHREIEHDFVLKYVKDIHLHFLYDDELFQKYVIARCKQELKRVIASHEIQLPGGVTLQADEICAGADEMVESIETILKDGSGIGDVILWRQ